ncbi:MAG: succinate dehydrogenase assembly factor 2 [Betaproteobacteria bacterium]|jgi:antitoxin CptB
MNVVDSFLAGLDPHTMLGVRELSKLRWRCRRGLLENDLMIEAFFNRYEKDLTVKVAQALYDLMDLSDNDLMDLFLKRTELTQDLYTSERQEVLDKIRK